MSPAARALLGPADAAPEIPAPGIQQALVRTTLKDTIEQITRSRQRLVQSGARVYQVAGEMRGKTVIGTRGDDATADNATPAPAPTAEPSSEAVRSRRAGVRAMAQLAKDRAETATDAGDFLSGIPKGVTARQGYEFLNKYLGLNTRLAAALDDAVKDGYVTQEQLEYFGKVVNDIAAEQAARHERLLTFLADLQDAQVDLFQENIRHADAMLAIANIELRRWNLLATLNQVYADVYAEGTPNHPADGRELFIVQARADQLSDRAVQTLNEDDPQAKPFVKSDTRRHPFILRGTPDEHSTFDQVVNPKSDNVLISIRKLSDTAKKWQNQSQSLDPDGEQLTVANDRLFKAVRTVDGHLLMLSLNQHISEENGVRLRTELASHGVQLDGLAGRVKEAGFRLTLGDLKAFHASGITDKDIQMVTSTITNGLLTWVGIGVN
jgi:hypothetical protein